MTPKQAVMENEFVITRLLEAPRDAVYRAWTEPERLKQWFGPKGFATFSSRLDLRPGGTYHYVMRGPDGKEMWGKWVFREIAPRQRLVFVVSFSDKDLGVTRHPMNPNWPLETLSTVLFEDWAGKTLLTVRWAAGNAPRAERQVFDSSHDSMRAGWGGTMERLVAYLKEPAPAGKTAFCAESD